MIKLPPAKIADHGKVKLGTGDSQDLRPIKIKLPKAKIADQGRVKLGTGDSQDLRPIKAKY
jgi:hypothetical protein